MSWSCDRCGYGNGDRDRSCRSCGNARPEPVVPPGRRIETDGEEPEARPWGSIPDEVHPAPVAGPQDPPFFQALGSFGQQRFEGIVLSVSPESQVPKPRGWGCLFKILLTLLLLPGILAVALLLKLVGLSGGSSRLMRDMFILNVHRDMARHDTIPARDVRLQRTEGGERILRMVGYPDGGLPAPGDDIVAWGPIKRGTMIVNSAFNLRTDSWLRFRKK